MGKYEKWGFVTGEPALAVATARADRPNEQFVVPQTNFLATGVTATIKFVQLVPNIFGVVTKAFRYAALSQLFKD